MKKVMIGTPSFDGKVTLAFMQSFFAESIIALENDMALMFVSDEGSSDISLSRNYLISEFINTDFDDFIFIDSDQGWTPGAVTQICKHKKDIVGGGVPAKVDFEHYNVRWLDEKTKEDGLIQISGIGTGFLKISRAAILDLIAQHPELEYAWPKSPKKRAWALFLPGVHEGVYHTEDMAFCRLAKLAGYGIYLDPHIGFTHTGIKHYSGNIGESLK